MVQYPVIGELATGYTAIWDSAMFAPCTSPVPAVEPPFAPRSPLRMSQAHAEVIPVAVPETFAFTPPSSHTCQVVAVRVTVAMCQELPRRSDAV